MPSFFDDIIVKLPIIIGTVPLMFSSTYPHSPTYHTQNIQLSSPNSNAVLPIVAPITRNQTTTTPTNQQQDLGPPTYEESLRLGGIAIDEEGEHAMGHRPFNPRYPVYKFDATAGFRVLANENDGEFSRTEERTSL